MPGRGETVMSWMVKVRSMSDVVADSKGANGSSLVSILSRWRDFVEVTRNLGGKLNTALLLFLTSRLSSVGKQVSSALKIVLGLPHVTAMAILHTRSGYLSAEVKRFCALTVQTHSGLRKSTMIRRGGRPVSTAAIVGVLSVK